ncbi:3-carboxy-cis,cis-muconate cycloisomerase [Spirillospora sp. CA-253888]
MSSPDLPPDVPGADLGLLSPVRAGTAVEAATGDAAFLRAMLDAEVALTRAQARVGLAPAGAAEAVTEAAAGGFDLRGLAERARSGGNPVIPLVKDLTGRVAAEHRPYVHRGATSQDVLDTALMLVAKTALSRVVADLDRTAAALAALAAEHRATPMPGRTLTQQAVPTTFGLKAAGWRSLVLDGRDRLHALVLPAQLGGAAGTLAAFGAYAAQDGLDPAEILPRLVTAFAEETGLAAPALPWHVLRTPVADLGAALALATGALGKLAADVLVLSRTEIGEVAEGGGGGSSAMPHKSNPARATLIASAARQLPALASVLLASMAAEDERPPGAWHAEWQPLREALRLTGGAADAAADLAAGLVVRPERMRANLDLTGGLIVSERAGIELSARLGRAEARRTLDDASRRAAAEGLPLAATLDEPDVDTDPATYLGAAPALTDAALDRESRP